MITSSELKTVALETAEATETIAMKQAKLIIQDEYGPRTRDNGTWFDNQVLVLAQKILDETKEYL